MTGIITEPLGNEVYAHFDGQRITIVKKSGSRTIAFIVLNADMLDRFATFLQLVVDIGQGRVEPKEEHWGVNESI